ncbi:hypothetical protein OIDMADRAFT_111720 [Oidiodendron maius Zn]|uniref:Cupin type-2 domain-containing protein n=1 Tax=Oidiodendron maius (strain Zn) TaxID=913774 RepID=A0A0C3DXL6_OIDMZ|nr:hypothetical protein OIDMADRAFT_111720 [Oidiodendron maius Zn]
MTAPSGLRAFKRYITTHNEEGKAIFSNTLPPEPTWGNIGAAKVLLGYTTNSFPAKVGLDEEDVKAYDHNVKNPPGIVMSNGTVLRIVDMRPKHVSPMHRTVSLDYCCCLEGTAELVLDSGESRILKRGDVVVERATMHLWRNVSDTEWVRMLYVLTPAEPVKVGDQLLGEDYGDMDASVPKST